MNIRIQIKLQSGFTLMEMLIVILFGSITLLAGVSVLSTSMSTASEHKLDVSAKQKEYDVTKRIISRVQEASYTYTSGTVVTISSTSNSISNMTVGQDGLVVLAPKFDSNGDLIQSGNDTLFTVTSFYTISGSGSKKNFIEASGDVSITAASSDPSLPDPTSLPTTLSLDAKVLAKDLLPATFTNMGTNLFTVENNGIGQIVNFAIVSQNSNTYVPHTSGGGTAIDDTKNNTNIVLRNS